MSNQETPAKPNAPWYLKAFVLFHVICITVWTIPTLPDDRKSHPVGTDWVLVKNEEWLKSIGPLQAYLFVTGTWQYWDMFAPNPSQTDIWCDAEIVYRDGSTKYYLYPRIYKLPIIHKYPQERYRKFYERVNSENYSYLWPQFALRIAYLNDNPANPPVTVKLTRHWLQVMPPGKPQPKDYSNYTYFEYVVDQRQLQKMREMKA